ncbi:hypothetical protein CAOG_01476 [Capsaspora owczarzaki ATCC 30864]|uniref:Uncharacterized protein n=1 Tax=Capsaspora owczarzaki (strain ATCC 30864) TaxID=595528 RepID=A0A0D2VJJ3_CAPO3|nr:hypothetical protein CAOG_01476 [Capsaspora owczarzaki ATCC 30864]KJE90127.1 hypothetical protein CAOG_001476 [Capsaspora owczarzaki ATCC 30864]|eukprot:XP_004364344.1 hypothetical protein CAOG_01476 [Capsaspora owczarzaki ATCC 30864]
MAERIRHDWFQTASHVSIAVFIKQVQREHVKLDLTPSTVSLTVKLPASTSEYSLELDLHRPIVVAESSFNVFGTKIEIQLKKQDQGVRWDALEGQASSTAPAAVMADGSSSSAPVAAAAAAAAAPAAESSGKALSYPTSAKRPHDWDKLVAEVNEEEKNEKPTGDDALNALFKQIYSNGNEETRRAMNKSFSESGGTVLSTNWGEVGSGEVKVQPPAGVQPKTWKEMTQ